MQTPITEFHPLVLPHLDGGQEEQWSTYSHDDGIIYLLNKDRYRLVNIAYVEGDIFEEIHFKTEWDCHSAAAKYYSLHGRAYPYMVEWSNLTWDVDTIVGETQSQIMEFV